MLKLEPNRARPYNDNADPKRARLRKLMDDPTVIKSRMDSEGDIPKLVIG
jgi:hypothetical protein